MTRVVVVAGFLGSGKTSLILGLGRRWAATGRRIAVVENEISSGGIDGQLLERAGLVVREVTAGCICCTLAGNLKDAVAELISVHAPDLICIEPTGAAGPGPVVALLHQVPAVGQVQVLAVVDALRVARIDEFNPSFLPDVLAAAHLVALTKCDAAGPEQTGAALRQLTTIDSRPLILAMDTAQEPDLAALATALEGDLSAGSPLLGGHGIAVATASRTLRVPAATAATRVATVLDELGAALAGSDGAIPGHLKAFIDGGAAGWLALSLTHRSVGCQPRGDLSAVIGDVEVTVSAIVAGVDGPRLAGLLDAALLPRVSLTTPRAPR